MEREEKILTEIENTMSLLGTEKHLEPDPYLYSKIKGKLTKEGRIKNFIDIKLSFGEYLKPAFFTILIMLNVYSIFTISGTSETNQITDKQSNYLDSISQEYMLTQSSYYSIIME